MGDNDKQSKREQAQNRTGKKQTKRTPQKHRLPVISCLFDSMANLNEPRVTWSLFDRLDINKEKFIFYSFLCQKTKSEREGGREGGEGGKRLEINQ